MSSVFFREFSRGDLVMNSEVRGARDFDVGFMSGWDRHHQVR